jgi:hypothetical protein
MWYQIARLITVQIALLLGCFCSVAVATIGYVAAMLLVKIEEEEVNGRVKFKRKSNSSMSREIYVRGGTSMQQHEEIVQGAAARGPIICFDREWLQVVDRRDRFAGDRFSPDRLPSASYLARCAWIRSDHVLIAIGKAKESADRFWYCLHTGEDKRNWLIGLSWISRHVKTRKEFPLG